MGVHTPFIIDFNYLRQKTRGKKMRKWLFMLMLSLLTVVLVACGDDAETVETSATTDSGETATSKTAA